MSENWYHEVGGTRYPRATHVLSIVREPGLDSWRAKVGDLEADKVMRRAAKVGTTVHKMIQKTLDLRRELRELRDQGQGPHKSRKPKAAPKLPPKAPDDTRRAWRAWCDWYEAQRDFNPSRWEECVANTEFGYSGTPDCIEDGPAAAGEPGAFRINDWKGTGRIREAHFIQLAAYVPLAWPERWREMASGVGDGEAGGIKLRIVRVSPLLGLFEEQERAFEPWMFDEFFLPLLGIYRKFYYEPALAALQERRTSAY